MAAALYVLYFINSAFLILVVLLQSGRGGGLGEFGGGSSSAVFGSRGASTLLQRLTVYSAATFMILSIALAILSTRGTETGRGEFIQEDAAPAELLPSNSDSIVPAIPAEQPELLNEADNAEQIVEPSEPNDADQQPATIENGQED